MIPLDKQGSKMNEMTFILFKLHVQNPIRNRIKSFPNKIQYKLKYYIKTMQATFSLLLYKRLTTLKSFKAHTVDNDQFWLPIKLQKA